MNKAEVDVQGFLIGVTVVVVTHLNIGVGGGIGTTVDYAINNKEQDK